jgi:hypothetical protein
VEVFGATLRGHDDFAKAIGGGGIAGDGSGGLGLRRSGTGKSKCGGSRTE